MSNLFYDGQAKLEGPVWGQARLWGLGFDELPGARHIMMPDIF